MRAPREILFLAFDGAQVLDVTGPAQIFAGVDETRRDACYRIRIAAGAGGPIATSSGLKLIADLGLDDIDDGTLAATDTLIVVGGDAGVGPALKDGRITAIVRRAEGRARRIASVCTGAFFLAAAGRLDGRRAATHWDAIERLRRFRPAVDVDPDAIHVRDGDIWTSAGVTAGIDLALAMVEADHDRETALAIARRNVVFRVRPGGQAQYSAELAGQAAGGPLARLTSAINAEPARTWTVQALADAAGMSSRTLTRQFRTHLGAAPAEFVERARVDFARRAMLDGDAQLQQIAVEAGFGGLRRMDRAFARVIGASPSEFRSRFRTPARKEPSCTRPSSASFSSRT